MEHTEARDSWVPLLPLASNWQQNVPRMGLEYISSFWEELPDRVRLCWTEGCKHTSISHLIMCFCLHYYCFCMKYILSKVSLFVLALYSLEKAFYWIKHFDRLYRSILYVFFLNWMLNLFSLALGVENYVVFK